MASVVNINMSFQAGSTYKLKIPTTLANDGGFCPLTGDITLSSNVTRTLKMGFCLESEEVGSLNDKYSDEVAVDYKQILTASNIIWFYAYTGERVRIISQPIAVHSHATMAQGGPAYGTYFSYVDDDTGGS